MIYLFTVIALVMPIAFIVRRQKVDDKVTLTLKCLATSSVIVLAFVNFFTNFGEGSYFALILVGLLLCLGGDFCLGYCHVLGKGHNFYNKLRAIGMLIFMTAHILFIINYSVHIDDFIWYMIFIPICMSILMFACSPLVGIRWPHPALAVISYLYMLAISLMLFTGLYYAIQILSWYPSERDIARACLVIAGSILFFTSDTILCFMYFGGRKGTPISIANLTTYFLSLILISLSV